VGGNLMVEQYFNCPCVLGAAGKMGRGIALLLLKTFCEDLKSGKSLSEKTLLLVDNNPVMLDDLDIYLKSYLKKWLLKSHIEDEEKCDQLVQKTLEQVKYCIGIEDAKSATIVFEAVGEDIPLKLFLFKKMAESCTKETLFLSNTSSIPIDFLSRESGLEGKMIGFHFYNPPPIQKLVEVIYPQTPVRDEFSEIISFLERRLSKNLVFSKDIAGFIGNGYFIREMLFAFKKVKELQHTFTLPESFYLINKIFNDYLIRPMGIFQLVDYVGLDVCYQICSVMEQFIPHESFEDSLLDSFLELRVVGGQCNDGSQKSGIFQYEEQNIIGIYDVASKNYLSVDKSWKESLDNFLGHPPERMMSWRSFRKEKDLQEKLNFYLSQLFKSKEEGSLMAQEFLINYQKIGKNLLESGLAKDAQSINQVLKDGFAQLYGPLEEDLVTIVSDS
jgi:3-hydroxyacyl-CoA dehydrogenase